MWVLFHVPCPTPEGQTAKDLYEKRWDVKDETTARSAVADDQRGGDRPAPWRALSLAFFISTRQRS